ncbi:MAG TPA: tetraacyldisaccharide 4'-kinase [Chitinophagaceae bacterium]|nr:tetraacyldisaccharide 4'-kinase [Chitinophagaceae bacterium]HAN38756.1 tetraacyldisaccharide 4'-kinase [Chitinophagaceae bacterium]
MNLNAFFLKSFRVLLLPFALLYGAIVWLRNYLFDKQILKSATFNFPLICIGNVAVGGTGKSPMVEYLIRLLHSRYQVATLSRGYKRKTKGYVLADSNTTAIEIGDEPMQFHTKFPNVHVAVGEERIVAIPMLLQDAPNTDVIILDDAFQHRTVQAGYNILLTEYSNLFTQDYFLPTGDLRDMRASYKRAQVIVVTKCPADITTEQKNTIIKSISPLPHQKVYFATIQYGIPYHIYTQVQQPINETHEILLVCGIANPKPLKQYLHEHASTYYQLDFSDHHIFNIDDLNEIQKKFAAIDSENKYMLTTEKDAVRLYKFKEELANIPLFVLPIEHKILFNEAAAFEADIIAFVASFQQTPTN